MATLGAAPCRDKATAAARSLQGFKVLSAAPLPVGCHLQAEASLHLHEILVVPQPVGHGQGEGCLLILQVGDLSLKRTEVLGIRGLELCSVQHRKR